MTYYIVNTEQVAYESMEGEIVLIHLDNGNYFNLEGTAIDVWNGIINNVSCENIIQSFVDSYSADKAIIEETVSNFISQLKTEELIIESTENSENDNIFEFTNLQEQFIAPSLVKYEDMQDLLLLDPLHDVDENAGWPAVK